MRSPSDYFSKGNLSPHEAMFERVAGLFASDNDLNEQKGEQQGQGQHFVQYSSHIKVTPPTGDKGGRNRYNSNHVKKISMGGVSGIFPTQSPSEMIGSTRLIKQDSLTDPSQVDSSHLKRKLSFGGVGDLFPAFESFEVNLNESENNNNKSSDKSGMSVDENALNSLYDMFESDTHTIYHNIDIMAETRQNNESWIEVANMFGANLDAKKILGINLSLLLVYYSVLRAFTKLSLVFDFDSLID